jgi:phosphate transport system substrate-binding protein
MNGMSHRLHCYKWAPRSPLCVRSLRLCMLAGHLAMALTLAAALASCVRTPTPSPTPVSLTIWGSTAAVSLLNRLAARFQAVYPSVILNVESSNSARVLDRVANGSASLGVISIAPPLEQWAAPLAVDGIVIVVHPDNPAGNLTMAQLYEVFSGRIWHWSELGIQAEEDEITVVSREEGSATRAVFEARVMNYDAPGAECEPALSGGADTRSTTEVGKKPALCQSTPVTSMAVLMPHNDDVAQFVFSNQGAIGYLSNGSLSDPEMPPLKAVRLEGLLPTPAHFADGSYPLSQPFFLVARQEPAGALRLFVDFCLGRDGQAIVAQAYAPVRALE